MKKQGLFYTDAQIRWFGADGAAPDWAGPAGILRCVVHAAEGEASGLRLLFNASDAPRRFVLPQPRDGRPWSVLVDTSRPLPAEAAPHIGLEAALPFALPARSMAVLGEAAVR